MGSSCKQHPVVSWARSICLPSAVTTVSREQPPGRSPPPARSRGGHGDEGRPHRCFHGHQPSGDVTGPSGAPLISAGWIFHSAACEALNEAAG